MKKILFSGFAVLVGLAIYAQPNSNCSGAAPFCSDNTYSFPMNTNAGSGEAGPDYGCLGSEPNPAWYYMQIDQAGNMVIDIASQQNEDVDFICYGPFPSLSGICSQLTAATIVDCSFSPSPTETCNIPNAQVGEIYLLLLTNFSNQFSVVNFNQTNVGQPGAGSSDCSILNVNAGNNGPLCTGDNLALTVDTVAGGSYVWSGPGGFTSSIPNPSIPNVTLANAGTYTCIVIDNVNSTSDTVTTTVTINAKPVASLTAISNPYCLGDPIVLDASGTTPLSDIVSFYYDLDHNGTYEVNTSTATYNATSAFSTAGNYPINLITEGGGGCTDTTLTIIQIYNNPTISATVTDPTVCIYNNADFQGAAFIFNPAGQNSTISNYAWDFDFNGTPDTNSIALTDVSHHFSGLGTHSVILTVTSNVGCVKSDTVQVTIVDIPHGSIVAPQVCGNQPASLSFNNTGLPISNFAWDFGDLSTTTDVSGNPAPNYQYPGSGTYGVTLIVGTADGCLDTMAALISIDPLPAGNITNTSVCQGNDETFQFAQTSTDTIQAYSWSFPGGSPSSSSQASPVSDFSGAGSVNVSLIITNQYGCNDTVIQPFLVRAHPVAQFQVYPICISRFTFDPQVHPDDQTVTLNWTMGDGTSINNVDTSFFNHLYTAPGDYNVSLAVVDQYGCTDSISQPVHVDDSLFVNMPNVLIQSSNAGNDKIDMDLLLPGFNLCINYTYTVFDRWGVKVFQTKNDPYNPDLYCNSCFKGSASNGATLTPGVYFYVMEGNFNIIKSGSITIFE